MKCAIVSPCASGEIDGTILVNLINHLERTGLDGCDVAVVPISYFSDYRFEERLPRWLSGKRWVLLDFLELGLDWNPDGSQDTHVLGRNSANFPRVSGPEWMKMDALVRDQPPIVYFKRELLERERTDWLHPIEFPSYLATPRTQSKEEFLSRPVEVLHYWGLSNPLRPELHGDIFKQAYSNGYEVISEFSHWDRFFADKRHKVWASIHAPHFARVGIEHVQHFIHRSKIGVSLPGAGYFCFRDQEVSSGSVPAYIDFPMATSYPRINKENCIKLPPDDMWWHLNEMVRPLSNDLLYDIYVASQENARKYESATYVRDYVTPLIQSRL